jgi:hypothetical protein
MQLLVSEHSKYNKHGVIICMDFTPGFVELIILTSENVAEFRYFGTTITNQNLIQ